MDFLGKSLSQKMREFQNSVVDELLSLCESERLPRMLYNSNGFFSYLQMGFAKNCIKPQKFSEWWVLTKVETFNYKGV